MNISDVYIQEHYCCRVLSAEVVGATSSEGFFEFCDGSAVKQQLKEVDWLHGVRGCRAFNVGDGRGAR